MDPNATDYGQGAANTASQNATNMAQSLPTVLNDLKGSLNSIFNTNNPLMQERTGMLSNYLSAGDQARASYLPTHSGFAFSPTELNAMVSSRQASALAPLAGVNNMIMGQYGGLNDYLGTAKDIFNAQVQAARDNAARLMQQYQNNLAQANAQRDYEEKVREFNLTHQGGTGTGTGYGTLNGILNPNSTNQGDPYAQFHTPNTPTPNYNVVKPRYYTAGYYNPSGASSNPYAASNLNSQPGLLENILNFFKPQPSSLNLGSTPLNISGSGLGNIKL